MSDFVFEDPSEEAILRGGRAPSPYLEIALAVKKHPGRWAKLSRDFGSAESARAAALNIRHGRTKGFEKGEWETLVDDKTIYIKYLPEDERTPSEPPQPAAAPGSPEEDSGGEDVGEVVGNGLAREARAWARGQGKDVPERGRLPRQLIVDYCEAVGRDVPNLRAVE